MNTVAIVSEKGNNPSSLKLPLDDVLAYRHEGVVERISKKEGLSAEESLALFYDLLRFLYMCGITSKAERGGTYAPPERIDGAWHHFILFTRDYRVFCNRYFGRLLHHHPTTTEQKVMQDKEGVRKTLADAKMLFGDLSANWATKHADCADCCNCYS
ncbi:MAG: glycine-rich domain-containing protein [Pyrinomonadaceae bacterium]